MTTLFSKFGLFYKIQSFIEARSQNSTKQLPDTSDLPAIWERMLAIDGPIEWSDTEIDIMLNSEKLKPFCHAQFKGNNLKGQTVLLGFDLKSNQLLVDEFFPTPSLGGLSDSFELTLCSSQGILILHVKIVEKVSLESQPAFLIDVLSKKYVEDRRLNPRVQFSRNTTPKVELLIPFAGSLKGNLLDLSSAGFTMVCFGGKKPSLLSNTGECTLHISEQIRLKVKMRVKQISHNRRPSNHTTFRVVFTEASDTQNDQLNAFIQSFEELKEQAA